MRVLIVEDVEINRKPLRAVLESEGFAVLEATDGLEALKVLEKERIDAVISDILMPNMDGYRLCYTIRNDPRWKDLPFIIYSQTYLSASDEKVALEVGADKFLRKPAPQGKLVEALRDLSGRNGRTPPKVPLMSEKDILKEYNEELIRKLEDKNTELRETIEKFNAIVEHIAEVFWISDPRVTKMLYVSPMYEKIWGRTCRSLYERPESFRDSIHLDDRSRVLGEMEKQGWDEAYFNDTFRILHPDGSVRWIHARNFPVRSKEGHVSLVAGVASDITEQRLAQQTLRRTEFRLQQSQKMEAIGRLAGGIAHDFNNLLAAISGFGELALGRVSKDDLLQKHLQEILKAADRAAELTRQLLTMSRRQPCQPIVLDLNAVAADMRKMLQRMVGPHIDLATRIEKSPVLLTADRSQIEQVIMNLVINARDAMPDGGRVVILTANVVLQKEHTEGHPGAKAGPHVLLSVEDNGCGMDAQTRINAFEPFFTTKEPGKGTGLGLSIVFGIVSQSGGYIDVDSEPGRGTKFSIYWPLHEEKERRSEPWKRES